MCGRFAVNKKQVETWVVSNLMKEFHCQHNLDLCPSQTVSTIIKSDEQNRYRQQDSLWGIYPSPFKMQVSERLSDSNSRRIYTVMVIPLQIDATKKWDCSSASLMGLKVIYAAL